MLSVPPNWDGNFCRSFFFWRWSHKSRFRFHNFISSVPILNKPNKKERRKYNLSFEFYDVEEMMNCRNGFCHSSAFLHICEFQKSNCLLLNIKLPFRFFVIQLLQFKTSSIVVSHYQCMHIKLYKMHFSQGKFNLWALKNEKFTTHQNQRVFKKICAGPLINQFIPMGYNQRLIPFMF